jgi:Cof subfamily protein (haloacid dehalogenase superfamily)
MKYPYIASDLDGTISLHKNFEILPETIQDIITYQTKSNHHFTIATGRNYQMVKHYIDDLQIKLPIVTVNGAAVVDVVNEKVIAYTEFPKAAMLELVNYCIQYGIDFSIHTPLTVIGKKGNERFQAYYAFSKDWPVDEQPQLFEFDDMQDLVASIEEEIHIPLKLTVSFPLSDRALADQFNRHCDEKKYYHPETLIHDRILIDVLEESVNKGFGIKCLAESLGLDPSEIVTFGDNTNDIEMTKQAAVGCAVGNAVPQLKAVAKVIVDTIDNNGVGKYLKENF